MIAERRREGTAKAKRKGTYKDEHRKPHKLVLATISVAAPSRAGSSRGKVKERAAA
jgi:hypothetical protein